MAHSYQDFTIALMVGLETWSYFLVDEVYPKWSTFVDTISKAVLYKKALFYNSGSFEKIRTACVSCSHIMLEHLNKAFLILGQMSDGFGDEGGDNTSQHDVCGAL